jgi:hypothetical protein
VAKGGSTGKNIHPLVLPLSQNNPDGMKSGLDHSPIMMQALVGSNSKDASGVSLKRKILEKRGYKEPLSTRSGFNHQSHPRNPFSY